MENSEHYHSDDQATRKLDLDDSSTHLLGEPIQSKLGFDARSLVGQTVGGYQLKRLLGAGTFGAVYVADEPIGEAGGREVAIKVSIPRFEQASSSLTSDRHEYLRRFEREARIIAGLRNKHIVPLFSYGTDTAGQYADLAYMVMPVMDGGALDTELKRRKPTHEQVIEWLNQIAAGLSYAHAKGVIHRDIKPSNFLLDSEGNVYVSDFGISQVTVGPNKTESIAGTREYMPPEQYGPDHDARADIYSLGIMLFEMLAGQYPFKSYLEHLSEPLPPLEKFIGEAKPELDAVLRRATAKAVDERYPNVTAFASAVRVALFRAPAVSNGQARISDTPLNAPNPYKGLQAFGEADAGRFYGRKTLVQNLVGRLAQNGEAGRFVAVVGPSGSGKSSVVNAGLLPSLKSGDLPRSQHWHYATMTPGERPLEELEAALLGSHPDGPASLLAQLEGKNGLLRALKRLLTRDETAQQVLVIDQFEELFTQTQDEKEREHFLNILTDAVTDSKSRLRLIVALRGDFYDRPLAYREFGELVRKHTEVVLPLSQEELRSAIEDPVRAAGAKFEPGLIETIIAEVEGEPGALPLLQYMLSELYERDSQQGRWLKRETYDAIGGVTSALGKTANALYESLDTGGQRAARQVFLRLVSLGEATEDTRRRAPLAEVENVAADARRVIDLYSHDKNRLLTLDRNPKTKEATVEVAHEALIRNWERFRQWLDEHREELILQRRLTQETQDWLAEKRHDSYLATGGRLAQFEEFSATTSLALTPEENDFVRASMARRKLLADAARRRQRIALAATLTALVVVSVLALLALNFGVEAGVNAAQAATNEAIARSETNARATSEAISQRQRDEAQARAWGLQALNALEQGNLTLAQALAEQAISIDAPPLEAKQAFYQVAYAPGIMRRYTDGDGTTGKGIQGLDAVFSPNGRRAYVAYGETESALSIMVLDGETGQFLEHWVHSEGMSVREVVLSPNKQQIIVGYGDGSMQLWDIATQKLIKTFPSEGHVIDAVAFSPDGQLIASITETSGAVVVRNATTGEVIQRFAEHIGGWDVEFAPDGQHIVSVGGGSNTPPEIYLWNIESGQIVKRFEGVHTDSVWEIGITLGSNRLVSVSQDSSVVVWDFDFASETFGQALHVMRGHRTQVGSIAFHPDGNMLATGGIDPNGNSVEIILWDVRTGREVRRFEDSKSEVWRLAFSPDGESLTVGSSTRSANFEVYVLNTETGDRQVLSIEAQGNASGQGLVYLNNDELLIAWVDGVYLWSLSRGQIAGYLNNGVGYLPTTLAVSPSGSVLYSGYHDGGVIAIDTATGKALWKLPNVHTSPVTNLAVSKDGLRLLSASAQADVQVLDARQGRVVATLGPHKGPAWTALFSPESDVIASVAASSNGGASRGSGEVVVWDASTYQELRRFPLTNLLLIRATGNGVTFTRDGNGLLIAGLDGDGVTSPSTDIVLLNIETGEEIRRFRGHDSASTAVAFNGFGTRFASVGYDNALIIWDFETGEILHRITEHRTGNLSMVAVNPMGTRAISMDGIEGRVSQLLFYNLRPGLEDRILSVSAASGTHPFTQKGEILGYSNRDGLREIDIISQDILRDYPLREGMSLQRVIRGVIPQNDNRAVLQLEDESYLVLDRAQGRILSQRAGRYGAFTVTPSGNTVISLSDEGRLIMWDGETGEVIQNLVDKILLEELQKFPQTASLRDRLTAYAFAAAVSSDGRFLLTGGLANPAIEGSTSVKLWDLESQEVVQRFNEATVSIYSVAFTHDDQYVIAGSADGSIKMWSLKTGALIREFLGHKTSVWTLSISPDGAYLLGGDNDGTAILWDIRTGQRLYQHQGDIMANTVISPDGTRAFVNDRYYAGLWRIESIDEALVWLRENRYIRPFTPEECAQYNIEPCNAAVSGGEITPTPTPQP